MKWYKRDGYRSQVIPFLEDWRRKNATSKNISVPFLYYVSGLSSIPRSQFGFVVREYIRGQGGHRVSETVMFWPVPKEQAEAVKA